MRHIFFCWPHPQPHNSTMLLYKLQKAFEFGIGLWVLGSVPGVQVDKLPKEAVKLKAQISFPFIE